MKTGDKIDLYHTFTLKNEQTLPIPEYKAQIDLGGFIIQVKRTYTDEQIKHIKEYFGWEVTNYERM